jgi:hypothetical protein
MPCGVIGGSGWWSEGRSQGVNGGCGHPVSLWETHVLTCSERVCRHGEMDPFVTSTG